MTEDDKAFQAIKDALNLDGNPETVQQYYENWAETYDTDVEDEAYTAPRLIVQMLRDVETAPPIMIAPTDPSLNIMDAGCGTGLVGQVLYEMDYRHIDGFDLSPAMTAEAEKLGVYRNLRAGVDLTQPLSEYADQTYDVVFCCGVFTLGHVAPAALNQLINLTKQGGLILVSTRTGYYDSTDYQAVSDELEAIGQVKLITRQMDQSYTRDSKAHYWMYIVT